MVALLVAVFGKWLSSVKRMIHLMLDASFDDLTFEKRAEVFSRWFAYKFFSFVFPDRECIPLVSMVRAATSLFVKVR